MSVARSPHMLRLLRAITVARSKRESIFAILLKSCWQCGNSLPQVSQNLHLIDEVLPHLSLTFFHPSFTSPPATAARSAIPLCPVITSYSSFLGKGQGRE